MMIRGFAIGFGVNAYRATLVFHRTPGGTAAPPKPFRHGEDNWIPHITRYSKLDPLHFQPPHTFLPDPVAPPYPFIPKHPPPAPSERGNDAPTGQKEIETATGTDGPLDPFGPTIYRAPPGRRVTERKYKATGMAVLLEQLLVRLSHGLGKLLDLRDLATALHDSLPKELQLKGKEKKQLHKVLETVWNNLDKMHGEKALLNIIKEVAEDVVGGVTDKWKADISKELGWFKSKLHLSARF